MGIVSNQISVQPFVREVDIAVAHHSVNPRIIAYPWSAGFGTKYADPATFPAGRGYGIAFSPN